MRTLHFLWLFFLIMPGLSCQILNNSFENNNAVSYTHLDVYKRQVFTIHTGGSGKKLIGNDITEYSGVSPDLKSRFVVNTGAQLNIGCHLTPSWFVSAQVSWFKSLQNTSNQESSVNKPSFVGLGLGVGYGF